MEHVPDRGQRPVPERERLTFDRWYESLGARSGTPAGGAVSEGRRKGTVGMAAAASALTSNTPCLLQSKVQRSLPRNNKC